MRSLRDAIGSDSGFSLVELLVAAFISVLVLTAAYLLFEAGLISFSQIDTNTQESRDVAQALQLTSKGLREVKTIVHTTANEIEFTGDINDDGVREDVTYYLDTGTSRLMQSVVATGHAAMYTVLARNVINATYAGGTPMFQYFSSLEPTTTVSFSTTIAPPGDGATLMQTQIIRVTVVTQVTGASAPHGSRPFIGATDVRLRTSLY